jgi:hypothetical protein
MDKALDALRKYMKTIVIYILGFGIIFFIGFIAFIFIATIFTVITAGRGSIGIFPIILGLVAMLLGGAFYLCSNIGIIKIANQEFSKEKVYAHNAIGAAFKNTFKVCGVLIVGTIVFIPILAVFAGIGYLLYKVFEESLIFFGVYGTREILLIIAIIVMVLLFMLVFTGYTTLFSFSVHALVLEKKGVIGSLRRSAQLVKNDFWKLFGYTLLFGLTIYAITMSLESFLALLISLIFLVLKFLNFNQDFIAFLSVGYTAIRWPLNLLSWLIISPISTLMLTYLYYNQRFKKEGHDMLLRLRNLEGNN